MNSVSGAEHTPGTLDPVKWGPWALGLFVFVAGGVLAAVNLTLGCIVLATAVVIIVVSGGGGGLGGGGFGGG